MLTIPRKYVSEYLHYLSLSGPFPLSVILKEKKKKEDLSTEVFFNYICCIANRQDSKSRKGTNTYKTALKPLLHSLSFVCLYVIYLTSSILYNRSKIHLSAMRTALCEVPSRVLTNSKCSINVTCHHHCCVGMSR